MWPLGALAVMAEMVGPEGQVVGINFSDPAVQRARSIASTLGLDNVEVRVGDVHDLDGQALGSAFDLAYTRLFLVHQRDPAQTMRRIAGYFVPVGGSSLTSRVAARRPARRRRSMPSPRTGTFCMTWSSGSVRPRDPSMSLRVGRAWLLCHGTYRPRCRIDGGVTGGFPQMLALDEHRSSRGRGCGFEQTLGLRGSAVAQAPAAV